MTNRERGEKWLADWADFANAPLDEGMEVRGEFLDALAKLQDEACDAAIAALTSERDAADFERDIARKARFAAESERDASNLKREETWKELQAARADAAAMREYIENLPVSASQLRVERGGKVVFVKAISLLNGDAGRDLLAYVAALEAEHAALAELEEHEALACLVDPPCGGCDACSARIAHAAVEALRTVKT